MTNLMIDTTALPIPVAAKVCPNCGDQFAPGGRGLGKKFCKQACRTDFNARAKAEGGVMATLVKAWVQNRHAKPGTREAEVCGEARRELTEIARLFLDADEAAGRPPLTDFVEDLLRFDRYIDRTRKA